MTSVPRHRAAVRSAGGGSTSDFSSITPGYLAYPVGTKVDGSDTFCLPSRRLFRNRRFVVLCRHTGSQPARAIRARPCAEMGRRLNARSREKTPPRLVSWRGEALGLSR